MEREESWKAGRTSREIPYLRCPQQPLFPAQEVEVFSVKNTLGILMTERRVKHMAGVCVSVEREKGRKEREWRGMCAFYLPAVVTAQQGGLSSAANLGGASGSLCL